MPSWHTLKLWFVIAMSACSLHSQCRRGIHPNCGLWSPRRHDCRRGTTWYCANLLTQSVSLESVCSESLFPQGFSGSNPDGGVSLFSFHSSYCFAYGFEHPQKLRFLGLPQPLLQKCSHCCSCTSSVSLRRNPDGGVIYSNHCASSVVM